MTSRDVSAMLLLLVYLELLTMKHCLPSKFCEENLPVKPSAVSGGCRRLSRKSNGPRPRRLLVQLTSETSATHLLYAAESLKNNDYEFARSIYINPDLTPAEAKMAYEKRQQGRQQRAVSTPAQDNITGCCSAADSLCP